MVTKIIANRFTPREKIGSGAFGDTFSAVALRTGNVVALKVENKRARQLEREARIYKELRGGVAIPKIHWYGSEGEYNFMAMDLLGPSLDELFELCSRRFTLKTVLMLADQMISRIEYVHTKNYVHRDIKPANFLMGANVNCNLCYLVDFGLAKKYRDESLAHSEFTEHHDLIGTARYASINAHLGSQLSRRDDLESLAYVLLYFLRGELPWQGVTAATKKEKYGKMLQKKMDTSVSALCRGLPGEFAMFLTYARGLRFDEEPNYVFIRTLFRILFQTMNYEWDHKFDWYRFSGKLGFMTSKENVEERKGDRLV